VSSATSRPFAARGGLALFRRSWSGPAQNPRVLVLVHGLAEHSGRYANFAEFLVGRGFRVHAYDHRGHGLSEGRRNDAPSFQHLVDDLARFLRVVRREEGERPLALLGHSAGALIAGALLAQGAAGVSAAVLTAPALALPSWWDTPRERLARLVVVIAPRFPVRTGVEPSDLSRDPEVVASYVSDPMVRFHMALRLGAALLDGIADLRGRAGEIHTPVLLAYGTRDPLTPEEPIRRFAEGLLAPGSELRSYPDMRHEILNERGNTEVYRDIAGWLDARMPAPARAGARP